MIRFFFLNQPINYINFSIDLLSGHIIRLVNVVHEDSIMLRFQTVQKVHHKQYAKMEISAPPKGCVAHYPPKEGQIQHLQILYILFKRSGSQGGWDFIRSGFVNGVIYCFLLEIAVALDLPVEGLACAADSQGCPPTCAWPASHGAGS